jgi:hypothetical protein
MKHPIAHTRNGAAVYVDLVRSRAAIHIAQQPHMLGLVKELVEHMTARTVDIRMEKDMGRPIGYNAVVETSDADTILYAQLLHDDTYTRFIKNGKPDATQYLSVIMHRDDENNYELLDTWIGRLSPPRPDGENDTDSSKSYWANHAFVLDGQSVQTRTVTKVCPY